MSQIIVILGSKSDRELVEQSGVLEIFRWAEVTWEMSIVSAHRHPDQLLAYCRECVAKCAQVFIGVAGMAAALPGAISAAIEGRRPVLGVALASDVLGGLDALLSMVRMPRGVPVGACGIGTAGLLNAGMLACQIVALGNEDVADGLERYRNLTEQPVQIGILKGESAHESEQRAVPASA